MVYKVIEIGMFMPSILPNGTTEHDGNQYYKFSASWLNDNTNTFDKHYLFLNANVVHTLAVTPHFLEDLTVIVNMDEFKDENYTYHDEFRVEPNDLITEAQKEIGIRHMVEVMKIKKDFIPKQ